MLKRFTKYNIKDKKLLVRSCFNVPISSNGLITDFTRLKKGADSLKEMIPYANKIFLIGHLGRPKGIYNKDLNLIKIKNYLEKYLHQKIDFLDHKGNIQKLRTKNTFESKIILLDNIRFFPEEESKNKEEKAKLASALSNLGNIFINDSFPDYKPAVSTYHLRNYIPSFLGNAFINELNSLKKINNPRKPFIAILGGAKISSKIPALKSLLKKADKILIGGGMAYTFLKSSGFEIGHSIYDKDLIKTAKSLIDNYPKKIILPKDHIIIDSFKEPKLYKDIKIIRTKSIPPEKIAIDIGFKTIQNFKEEIKEANTILWNGPMGVFEWNLASQGTYEIARSILKNKKAFKLVGGGDSVAAINRFSLNGFNHVSTGGGAMLEYISKGKLDIVC